MQMVKGFIFAKGIIKLSIAYTLRNAPEINKIGNIMVPPIVPAISLLGRYVDNENKSKHFWNKPTFSPIET